MDDKDSKAIQGIINEINEILSVKEKEEKQLRSRLTDPLFNVNSLKKRINELNEEIKGISASEISSSFPNDVKNVMNHIKNEKIEAIGPLCAQISFKTPEFETAARYVISDRVWYSFLAFSPYAREKLRSQVFHRGKIVRMLHIRSINPIDLPTIGIGRLIDGIDADPRIKAYLYDKMKDIIVARNQSEADELMKASFSAITLEGILCVPFRNFEEEERRQKSRVPFSATDVEKKLDFKKKELDHLKKELKESSKQLKVIQNDEKSLANKIFALKQLVKYLEYIQNQLLDISPIVSRHRKLVPIIESWNSLKTDLKKKSEDLDKIKTTFVLGSDIFEFERKISQLIADRREKGNIINKIELEIEKRRHNSYELRSELADIEEQIQTSTEKQNGLIVESSRIQAKLQLLEEKVRKYAELPALQPPDGDDLAKIRNAQQVLKKKTLLLGTVNPNVEYLLEKEKKVHEKLKKGIDREEANRVRLFHRIEESVDEWTRNFKDIVKDINIAIEKVLEDQEYKVILQFDHKGAGIDTFEYSDVKIAVYDRYSSAQRDLDGFSGGEKSMVAMAILLGMQSIDQNSMVRFLDEFDQSLDNKNREFVRDKIIEASHSVQYIVLSPGDSPELGVGAWITKIRKIKGSVPEIKQGWNPLPELSRSDAADETY
ncbi:MAG: hypothetical protein ACFFD4_36920 [Candidatus Odinarchaeota archaeon]